jgi:hypothetical protein
MECKKVFEKIARAAGYLAAPISKSGNCGTAKKSAQESYFLN